MASKKVNIGNKNKPTLKRKFISLEEKIKILDRLKNGDKAGVVAHSMNLNESTVRTIKSNEKKIRDAVCAGSSISLKRVSRVGDILMGKMEKALIIWIDDCIKKRIPLDGNVIKQKSIKIYQYLKETGQISLEESSDHEFCASKGWFENFKNRFALHNLKVSGETASADEEAAHKFPAEFLKIIEEGGYTADQVFNADETGLNWKKMPQRTYIFKNEKCAPGFKATKDRITLLLCSNASGDLLAKPMFIYRSLNPRAMKNVDKSGLPVLWRANKKAWMTGSLFNDWFYKCFVPEVEDYTKKKNINFKILLVIDNAPGHPKDLYHPNVKIVFLPPNTTSLIQPLDQGIISTLKAYYIRQTFQIILDRMDGNPNLTAQQLWKDFSILNCVEIVSLSLKELKPKTLNACWKTIWPEIVFNENAVPPLDVEVSRILNLAHSLDGEGFNDMVVEDIHELFNDIQELNEDELVQLVAESDKYTAKPNDDESSAEDSDNSVKDFTIKTLRTGLDLANNLKTYFENNDPSSERSAKFNRQLEICLAPYYELQKELRRNTKQSRITDFLTITKEAATDTLSRDENNIKEISSKEDIHPILNKEKLRNFLLDDSNTSE